LPSIRSAVIEFLKIKKGRKYTYAQLYREMQIIEENLNPNTLSRTLRGLAEENKIQRDKQGRFWFKLEDDTSAKLDQFLREGQP